MGWRQFILLSCASLRKVGLVEVRSFEAGTSLWTDPPSSQKSHDHSIAILTCRLRPCMLVLAFF